MWSWSSPWLLTGGEGGREGGRGRGCQCPSGERTLSAFCCEGSGLRNCTNHLGEQFTNSRSRSVKTFGRTNRVVMVVRGSYSYSICTPYALHMHSICCKKVWRLDNGTVREQASRRHARTKTSSRSASCRLKTSKANKAGTGKREWTHTLRVCAS